MESAKISPLGKCRLSHCRLEPQLDNRKSQRAAEANCFFIMLNQIQSIHQPVCVCVCVYRLSVCISFSKMGAES